MVAKRPGDPGRRSRASLAGRPVSTPTRRRLTMSSTEASDLEPATGAASRVGSRFFRLPVHSWIEWEMKVCMDGIESGAVIGPAGVGKSYSVKRLKERIEAEEKPSLRPRESGAQSGNHLLRDLQGEREDDRSDRSLQPTDR